MSIPRAGTTITFHDIDPKSLTKRYPKVITREGQVWSPAHKAGCAWVIPSDRKENVVLVQCPNERQQDRGILPRRIDGAGPIGWLTEKQSLAGMR